jgi:hypothetical protein
MATATAAVARSAAVHLHLLGPPAPSPPFPSAHVRRLPPAPRPAPAARRAPPPPDPTMVALGTPSSRAPKIGRRVRVTARTALGERPRTGPLKGKCALGPFLSILVIECQHKCLNVNLCPWMNKVQIMSKGMFLSLSTLVLCTNILV